MIERFRKIVFERFLVRFHIALIFAAVISSGVLSNRWLTKFDLGMGFRYFISIIISYLTFLILIEIWVHYVVNSLGYIDLGKREPVHPVKKPEKLDSTPEERWALYDIWLWFPEELGLALFIMFIVSLLSGGLYFIVEAPIVLTEAAFSMALSAGLIRGARESDRPLASEGVLGRTIVPFLTVLVLSFIVGGALQIYCPRAHKVMDAIRCGAISERS